RLLAAPVLAGAGLAADLAVAALVPADLGLAGLAVPDLAAPDLAVLALAGAGARFRAGFSCPSSPSASAPAAGPLRRLRPPRAAVRLARSASARLDVSPDGASAASGCRPR